MNMNIVVGGSIGGVTGVVVVATDVAVDVVVTAFFCPVIAKTDNPGDSASK